MPSVSSSGNIENHAVQFFHQRLNVLTFIPLFFHRAQWPILRADSDHPALPAFATADDEQMLIMVACELVDDLSPLTFFGRVVFPGIVEANNKAALLHDSVDLNRIVMGQV